MSLKWPSISVPKALVVTLGLVLVGVAITWLDFRNGPSRLLTLLTVSYVVVVSICVRGALKKPADLSPSDAPSDKPHSRVADFVKSIVFMSSGILWVAVGVKVLPDTNVSVAIVLVPFGVLALTSGYFFLRSVWIPLR
jgi:hypothetical protein